MHFVETFFVIKKIIVFMNMNIFFRVSIKDLFDNKKSRYLRL